MKALYVQEPVDCRTFRRFAHAFLDDELAGEDRGKLREHLDACPPCAASLEVEASFGRGLRARLTRVEAPSGLEARIRARLTAEPQPPASRSASRGGVAAALLAASVALALLTIPTLLGPARAPLARSAGMQRVVREATVVDLLCDEHGLGLAAQRSCRNPAHINALKLANGTYWGILEDAGPAADLATSPASRGRRLSVEGTFYPAIQSIAISSIRDLATAGLGRAGGSPGIDGLATLVPVRCRRHRPSRGDA